MIVNGLIVLGTFLVMESVAWLTHKYIMHGFLWVLHKDHHDKSHSGDLELNDFFFVLFALPAMALMYYGGVNGFNHWFYISIGITLYGMAYFFVHDIFIHQRVKFLRNTKSWYLLGIRRAHKEHHKHLGKEDGECFGFLYVPFKYFKKYKG